MVLIHVGWLKRAVL